MIKALTSVRAFLLRKDEKGNEIRQRTINSA